MCASDSHSISLLILRRRDAIRRELLENSNFLYEKKPYCCLMNEDMKIGQSIGISNEQIEENALIEIKDGILILIKSRD